MGELGNRYDVVARASGASGTTASTVRLNAGRDITLQTTTVNTSATTVNSTATRTEVDRIATVSALTGHADTRCQVHSFGAHRTG